MVCLNISCCFCFLCPAFCVLWHGCSGLGWVGMVDERNGEREEDGWAWVVSLSQEEGRERERKQRIGRLRRHTTTTTTTATTAIPLPSHPSIQISPPFPPSHPTPSNTTQRFPNPNKAPPSSILVYSLTPPPQHRPLASAPPRMLSRPHAKRHADAHALKPPPVAVPQPRELQPVARACVLGG
jgi:hypothetical protein